MARWPLKAVSRASASLKGRSNLQRAVSEQSRRIIRELGFWRSFGSGCFFRSRRRRLLGNYHAGNFIVGGLRNDFLTHEVGLHFVGTPVDNFLSVRVADSRQCLQLFF